MKTLKTLILAAVLTFGSCLATWAKTTQLTLRLKDGRSIVLDLSASGEGENRKLPIMTFTPTTLKVELPPQETTEPGEVAVPQTYTFEVEDLQAMQPIETNTSSLNEILVSQKAIAITPMGGDLVKVTSAKSIAADDVAIYDLSGHRQTVETTADSDNSLTISLASLQPGIYIVNVESYTLKITKK